MKIIFIINDTREFNNNILQRIMYLIRIDTRNYEYKYNNMIVTFK